VRFVTAVAGRAGRQELPYRNDGLNMLSKQHFVTVYA